MAAKRIDWRLVGLALIPAVVLSIVLMLVGGTLGLSEAAADRVSRIVFFPAFFAAYHYFRRRRAVKPA